MWDIAALRSIQPAEQVKAILDESVRRWAERTPAQVAIDTVWAEQADGMQCPECGSNDADAFTCDDCGHEWTSSDIGMPRHFHNDMLMWLALRPR